MFGYCAVNSFNASATVPPLTWTESFWSVNCRNAVGIMTLAISTPQLLLWSVPRLEENFARDQIDRCKRRRLQTNTRGRSFSNLFVRNMRRNRDGNEKSRSGQGPVCEQFGPLPANLPAATRNALCARRKRNFPVVP